MNELYKIISLYSLTGFVGQTELSDVGSSDDEAAVNAFVPMYALNNVN